MINLASDNVAGVHPDVLNKISNVNTGIVSSYGDDPYTKEAHKIIKEQFGADFEVFFVFNGTGANTVALSAMTSPYNMILTAPLSHITEDECGAVQKATGCPVRFVRPDYGKISPEHIKEFMSLKGDVHKSQPKAVSITQATERGEVYTESELASLYSYCRDNNLYLHIDGARFANAVAHLDVNPAKIAQYCDIMCLGGTKNGLMIAEAVLVRSGALAEKMPYIIKQQLQLSSKMRYISAQFLAYFENGMWLKNADHANKMAKRVYDGLKDCSAIRFLNKPEVNILFAEMDNNVIKKLQEKYYFYVIVDKSPRSTIRLVTSWQTEESEVESFIQDLSSCTTL